MADVHNEDVEKNVERISRWLLNNRAEFEGQGISEAQLPSALGMTEAEVTEAVDHLEERETAVRMPHGLSTPPQFMLKAGRGWPDLRDELLKGGAKS